MKRGRLTAVGSRARSVPYGRGTFFRRAPWGLARHTDGRTDESKAHAAFGAAVRRRRRRRTDKPAAVARH